ncbi:LacI family DNA-binding transcriptional regulator [Paracoccus aerius]
MARTKSTTVKDVAAAANVSRATAARALNGYGYVGSEAAERVLEAAARLGYRGNRVAQALRQGACRSSASCRATSRTRSSHAWPMTSTSPRGAASTTC